MTLTILNDFKSQLKIPWRIKIFVYLINELKLTIKHLISLVFKKVDYSYTMSRYVNSQTNH